MHLMYLDDSGSAPNVRENYLVLGGVCVHESQAMRIVEELDSIARKLCPQDPDGVEFHASEIFSGRRAPWSTLSRDERRQVIRDVLAVIGKVNTGCAAFACAVHKQSFNPCDPLALAFENLCSRLDQFLSQSKRSRTREYGLIILDESSHETSLQELARQFRQLGTRWGVIRHLADTPMFIKSSASRIVQLADHVAYAVFRRYESGDTSYFDIVASRFLENQGVIHGLAHKQSVEMTSQCLCPACLSRRRSLPAQARGSTAVGARTRVQ